jgi:hypothetical protein
MIRLVGVALLMALAFAGLARPAHAGSEIWSGAATCTAINCSSLTINSTVELDAFGNAHPVVFELKGSTGDCLRVDVTTEAADTQAVLVSPSGKVWSNDDRGYPDLRPLIVANADVVGFYTLTIGRYTGTGTRVNVTILYGQYPLGNPNCANPTQPFVVAAHHAK